MDIDDVTEHRKEMLFDPLDNFPIHKRTGRSVDEFKLHSAIPLLQGNVEICIAGKKCFRVIRIIPTRQDGQSTASEQFMETALTGLSELLNFMLRQHMHR